MKILALILPYSISAFTVLGRRRSPCCVMSNTRRIHHSLISAAGGSSKAPFPQSSRVSATEIQAASSVASEKEKTTNWTARVRSAMIPIAVSLFVGFRLGRAASSSSAGIFPRIFRYLPRPGRNKVITLLILLFCIREFSFALPDWLKSPSSGEMTSPIAIAKKLRTLFRQMQNKLNSEMGPAGTRFAFYSLVLQTQMIKKHQPQQRDQRYDDSGNTTTVSELKGLDKLWDFAELTYDKFNDSTASSKIREVLSKDGYQLIYHDKINLPGRVPHYVALNPKERKAMIAVKGTSSVEDMLTDACGTSVNYTLPNGQEITCHEGVLQSAKQLVDDITPLVQHLLLPSKYEIILTGHSLGAGAAGLAGIMLHSQFPQLHNSSLFHVYAFAPPPMVNYETAVGCTDYITTIVNNADVIPRASVANLAVLVEFMRRIRKKLIVVGKNPAGFPSCLRYIKWLYKGRDGDFLMTPEEMDEQLNESIEAVDIKDRDHLYVPGRVLHLYDLWTSAAEKEAKWANDDYDTSARKTAERFRLSNVASSALRFIETDPRMIDDHFTYGDSLRALLGKDATERTYSFTA